MSDTEKFFLQLVRLGIGYGNGLQLTDEGLLAKVDWEAVKALADRQGLSAVVLDGLNCFSSTAYNLPGILKMQWIGEILANYEARYKVYEEAIGSLAGWYNAHGLKMMVLKGYACSLDWPKPEHRPIGDLDIWLFGQQEIADDSLSKEMGIEIDNSHHHHTVFYWQDFMVENHYDFINVHARKSNKKLEKVFKELGKDDSHYKMVCGKKVYLPSPNLHALFLIRHMVAHFAAAEITLRQVLDWAFFVEKHGKDVDWKWLLSVLEEFGLRQFMDIINIICVEDLAFDFNHVKFLDYSLLVIEVDFRHLKERVLSDILCPEFQGAEPRGFFARVVFKWERWQGNAWKQRLCYPENRWSTFWSGVWNHLLKPASI